MLGVRVIPCLLLKESGLVKTVKFRNPSYVGDPINTVRIYNEKEVDELVFLDISATPERKKPPFQLIEKIASECFMPFTYGGGIRDIGDIQTIFSLGVEKVAINSFAIENPPFIRKASETFGTQSIVISIDAKKNLFGKYQVYYNGGRRETNHDPSEFAIQMEKMGAGEILITSIDRDGTFGGYDIALIRRVVRSVNVPIIACGGAGRIEDFREAIKTGGASAVAAGSMVVYQGKNRAVLVNFPSREDLNTILGK